MTKEQYDKVVKKRKNRVNRMTYKRFLTSTRKLYKKAATDNSGMIIDTRVRHQWFKLLCDCVGLNKTQRVRYVKAANKKQAESFVLNRSKNNGGHILAVSKIYDHGSNRKYAS